MKKYSVLGAISAQKFLREFWHKQPLLIRNAIPGFVPPVGRDALFRLAAQPTVESRLVSHHDKQWRLEHGPFKRLPALRKPNWSLLVQGVNLHDDGAATLLEQFRFIPDARLDDLMISYASDGGGVGPHFDSYDVFLLQAQGTRRWRIGSQQNLDLVEGLPLKILKDFEPEQEFDLEPGDMLYLPPHYAHDGMAIGECMTYSIGFRAPSYQELGESFLQFLMDTVELPGQYADPDLRLTTHPAAIQDALFESVATVIRSIRFDDEAVNLFLGEYLSEPKRGVQYELPSPPLSAAKFNTATAKRGIRLARQTRMLYRGRHVFINGESFVAGGRDKALLRSLGDERELAGTELLKASTDLLAALYTWYQDGWLHPC